MTQYLTKNTGVTGGSVSERKAVWAGRYRFQSADGVGLRLSYGLCAPRGDEARRPIVTAVHGAKRPRWSLRLKPQFGIKI